MKKQSDNTIRADVMVVMLPLSAIEPNEGQLEGLPSNPRNITREKLALLKKSVQEHPDMLSLRGLLVYQLDNGHYIAIGGNMRLKAMQELGYTEAPCVIVPKETPIEEIKAYSIIDNNGFGKWDWDMLANEWDENQLMDWGVDLPIFDGTSQSGSAGAKPEKDLSDKVVDVYEVVVECMGESEQERIFNKLTGEGYKCRVLTL
ncbi:ParB/RepB/Spo0J family partition protein [Hoylesella shahii]|uniref:ParB/RepB/Spo0J family partition protein n=1 Tax=Hoylesella shahii TaxID=228603 RepID=UPI0028E82F1E|nr:ParB/RepB/Spo0J family partition protein [Hoylesella shahii]